MAAGEGSGVAILCRARECIFFGRSQAVMAGAGTRQFGVGDVGPRRELVSTFENTGNSVRNITPRLSSVDCSVALLLKKRRREVALRSAVGSWRDGFAS